MEGGDKKGDTMIDLVAFKKPTVTTSGDGLRCRGLALDVCSVDPVIENLNTC